MHYCNGTCAPSSWLIVVLLWWCMCTVLWADSWISVMAHMHIPAGWVLHCITSVTDIPQVKIATMTVEAGCKNPLFPVIKFEDFWRHHEAPYMTYLAISDMFQASQVILL